MADGVWLPELIECDWNRYEETIERAHAVFWKDFGDAKTRPTFQKRRLGLKRLPEFEGKSATFWHFVTEGFSETNRTPVRERLERIGWPRALIEEAGRTPSRVCVWATLRGRSKRWVIALEDFSYVVILDDRDEYLLPWTAFPVDEEHRRNKLRKERAAWFKGYKS
jgi:hypothetical protein